MVMDGIAHVLSVVSHLSYVCSIYMHDYDYRWDKVAAILQTTFSNAFLWLKLH